MKKCVALLLLLCLLLPTLTGCAQMDIYRLYFSGTGTKDPAAGAVTPPSAEVPAEGLFFGYDETYTVKGEFLSLENVSTNDALLLYIDEDQESEGEFTFRTVGVGTGTLVYTHGGIEYRTPVTVKPARLAVFFLFGEGDARGKREAATGSRLAATDGTVYYTFPEFYERYTADTVDDFVVEYLTENDLSYSYFDLFCKTNELTAAGQGRYAGLSGPLAYKWAEQTGEHVWIINLATENGSIDSLLPGTAEAENYAALAAAVGRTLARESEAGHYTHTRTGYFLCGGEKDAAMSAAAYYEKLTALDGHLKEVLTLGGLAPQFGGLIAPRAARADGREIARLSGPRTACLAAAAAGGTLGNTYLLADLPAEWYSDLTVSQYFARYDRHKFMIYYGYETPTSMRDLIASDGSYTDKALSEIAAVTVENLLLCLGMRPMPEGTPTLTFRGYNGIDEAGEKLTLSYGMDTVACAPVVTPLAFAKSVGATVQITAAGKEADLFLVRGLGNGQSATVKWQTADGRQGERTLTVERHWQFAFSDHLPDIAYENDRYVFRGYSAFFSCGYFDRNNGAYTKYEAIDYRTGWLYDGKNIWSGHGGVKIDRGCAAGPLAGWDAGYVFHVPATGRARVTVENTTAGVGDGLFAICLNGKVVWPKAADSPADDGNFYYFAKDVSAEELNRALADFSVELKTGDTLAFVIRRANSNQSVEVGILPIVTVE